MENNSIRKNSIDDGIEIYLVSAMSDCGETLENFVTLDRELAIKKAFNIYDDYDQQSVFIDTWKNNTIVKIGYIVDGKFIEEKFN